MVPAISAKALLLQEAFLEQAHAWLALSHLMAVSQPPAQGVSPPQACASVQGLGAWPSKTPTETLAEGGSV